MRIRKILSEISKATIAVRNEQEITSRFQDGSGTAR
jgi:hypothetical protein